jgi:hypothetical protein
VLRRKTEWEPKWMSARNRAATVDT